MAEKNGRLIDIKRWTQYIKDETQPPGGGDGMEARIAILEAAVEHIKTDMAEMKLDIREIRSSVGNIPYWFIANFLVMLGGAFGLIYFLHSSNQQFISALISALK